MNIIQAELNQKQFITAGNRGWQDMYHTSFLLSLHNIKEAAMKKEMAELQ